MHVNSITSTASQKPGMIKRVLLEAPKKIRKIAYVTFCRPLLEYGCGAWDPFLAKHIDQIEMGQQRAVRSISKLRGREGVTSEKESLGLELLQDAKVKLLLKISPSDTNSRLVDNFNNITTQQTALHFHVTRSVTLFKPLPITATKQVYFNRLLPKTSRNLRDL